MAFLSLNEAASMGYQCHEFKFWHVNDERPLWMPKKQINEEVKKWILQWIES